ncbi:MAG TPA: hypothetical protein VFU86_05105 [Terriglobales bacterium]|nr:hypothetical protein [Terriglobales bacterium]
MRKITLLSALVFGLIVGAAQAQQLDVAFGASGITSPNSLSSPSFSPQIIGGGTFLGFSADVLLKHQLGVQGEVNWRAKQNLWGGFQPFRPIFYDVNGIWAPRFGKRAGAEIMGGIGAESVRFYTGTISCSGFTGQCTDYQSSNHFLAHVGGGLKLYVTHSFFIRPEVHAYFVRNNFEFTSPNVFREGISIGYTFRPED